MLAGTSWLQVAAASSHRLFRRIKRNFGWDDEGAMRRLDDGDGIRLQIAVTTVRHAYNVLAAFLAADRPDQQPASTR